MSSTKSFLKVQYDLRPGKQIERRMLLDAFQLLSEDGFPIRKYTYVGMGSIHFYDFAIFHRFFGVKKMISVEWDTDISNRVQFNNPYSGCIKTKVGYPIADVIRSLDHSNPYLVWYDYDDTLRTEMLEDVAEAAYTLAPGSLLLITVDTEKPKSNSGVGEATNEETLAYYYDVGKNYGYLLDRKYSNSRDYSHSNLFRPVISLLEEAIRTSAESRGLEFFPLFNFLYADGHRMLTLGGFVTDKKTSRKLKRSELIQCPYVRSNLEDDPYCIRVPRITRKERLLLDSAMPCSDGWAPQEFEIDPEDVKLYREIYRFYPAYTEMLV